MTVDYVIPDIFLPVARVIPDAHLVAWDECHKIYLAMDEEQAEWFRENYPRVLESTAEAMLVTVLRWYENSCFLRFVQAVSTNHANPNAGYVSLIDQFAEEDDSDDDEDEEE